VLSSCLGYCQVDADLLLDDCSIDAIAAANTAAITDDAITRLSRRG
jgi:hypothetical protein